MMAPTLDFSGRDVGRAYGPPDRSGAGKTTRDLSFCYSIGSASPSGRGSMSGKLHAERLRGEKSLGFEGRQIAHWEFTFTPDLAPKHILNDVYNRIPTNVAQKLRNPHIDVVFDASFGNASTS